MTVYYLVSGGAGFIGIHLVRKLAIDPNNHITIIDSLITGGEASRALVTALTTEFINVHFIEGDITEMYILRQLPFSVDKIYHLASIASPLLYQASPLETLDVGYIGTKNMLDLARRNKAKILFASTSEVYGNPTVSPQSEEYYGNVNTVGTRSCYDSSKRIAETLMYTYHNIWNVNTCIARIFNTYGPGMLKNDGRLIPNIMNSLIDPEFQLIIYGDGSQTRCFTYIDDTVDGLIKLMDLDSSIGSVDDISNPINIGSDTELSINELLDIISTEIPGKLCQVEYRPIDKDDPKIRKPDINRAKKLLNWEPTTDIFTGLQKTYESWN